MVTKISCGKTINDKIRPQAKKTEQIGKRRQEKTDAVKIEKK